MSRPGCKCLLHAQCRQPLVQGERLVHVRCDDMLLPYAERGLTTQRNAERLECQCAWPPFDALSLESAAAPGL